MVQRSLLRQDVTLELGADMKLFGSCPSCGSRLPKSIKDRVVCNSCGKLIKADPKTSGIGAIIVMGTTYITYLVDWRLLFIAVPVSLIIAMKMTKYVVVDNK